MKIYLTGHTLDWFDSHEYCKKVLKMIWMEYDDIHMSNFLDLYAPLMMKKVINQGDVLSYNENVLFLSCLNEDTTLSSDLFLKSLTQMLSDFPSDYRENIYLIVPNEEIVNSKFNEAIVKSIIFTQFKNNLYVKSMENIEDNLLNYS